ncbi:MAG: TatD family hydrolase [Nannocystaceae bacterium]
MRLFDTHAHIDLPRFGSPEEQRLAAIRARQAGIAAILVPGIEPATWPELQGAVRALAESVEGVRFHTALGVHPQALGDLPPEDDDSLAERLAAALDADPGVVAIGECGLDFGPRGRGAAPPRQLAVLRVHLDLARRRGLPLLLHCLEAHGALVERLLEAPTPPSILHSYSGSAEVAERLCRAGHFISFAASLTLPRARRPARAAAAVPLDRLLCETDSPDQTPYPRRPARNEPAFLVDVVAALAAVRGESAEAIAEATTANACRVLGVAPP